MRRLSRLLPLAAALVAVVALPASVHAQSIEPQTQPPTGVCNNHIHADVIALDQHYFWNRLGAVQPHGMLYALSLDVVPKSGPYPGPGNAKLREEKRPRPIVLRMNEGDCLTIELTNYLHPVAADNQQVRTREVSAHVTGMQLVGNIDDDGSWVGKNPGAIGSLIAPGDSASYTYYGEKEGAYLLHSAGALTTGEGDNGTISAGLFGAVIVEPRGSTWYRSQLTQVDHQRLVTGYNTINRSDNGHNWTEQYPVLDYNQVHPGTHPSRPGLPVVKILNGNQIIYSDLTAIVDPGGSLQGQAPPNPAVYPNPGEPFREFTIIFHDEPGAVQAFPHFYDEADDVGTEPDDGLAYTLHSVRDAFAINYGTGGIGAEILANRLGVGPMYDCVNCLYEEFFLSSWAVGDPAMVVDVPANAPCDLSGEHNDDLGAPIEGEPGYCNPKPGPKAEIALYPDDPSNVYHSYQNDHVKFRNILAGSDDHHVFHLHAHQWLHTPNEDQSTYKDSQSIGQGTAFTYEIAFEGSGNRNKTPGDSIFHCHFYPHFAQGMWSMWRVHDVLETGTVLNGKGQPATGSRALPDGEIAVGTPIPAIVPLPGEPMPPPPSVPVTIVGGQAVINGGSTAYFGNPGYPFYIAGRAGQRAVAPPLDTYFDGTQHHDGGLPRHLIVDADIVQEVHSRFDFTKELDKIVALELDEDGEPWEKRAMNFHADGIDGTVDGFITTYKPGGGTGTWAVNGSREVPGAPYADPCGDFVIDPEYPPFPRMYAAANIEMDVEFNSEGWHFPQQRFLSLWGDVGSYFGGSKQPEPLFIRANSGDCVTYLHTNLVPRYYELDDFQVRTPTDILGQHIHLVKFDVTASDGSANGWNYEDGTLSPEEVRHLIDGINNGGGLQLKGGGTQLLAAVDHPYFQNVVGADSLGAQTTVQRWYVDPILNNSGDNRSLRTVFTHDHFGPSTHQQVGLYAGLLTYKGTSPGTGWFDGSTGVPLYGRVLPGGWEDGGPTTWNAVIRGPEEKFREFALEFGDFQHAYWPNEGYPDPENAINPPGRAQEWDQIATKPWIYEKPIIHGRCPNDTAPPCPEAVSADDPGTAVVNYRQESIALRVTDNPQASNPTLAAALRGDLSYAFSSRVHGDPDTPILRAYEEDPVHMRVLVGAHEEEHNFSIHGARWLFEPAAPDSGYKSSQMMGISEFYDFEIQNLLGSPNPQTGFVDFLYKAGSSVDDLWHGIWGLIRVYQDQQPNVEPVERGGLTANAANIESAPEAPRPELTSEAEFTVPHASICPQDSLPARLFDVVAVAARNALPGGRLIYNSRSTPLDECSNVDNPYPALDGYGCTSSGLAGPLIDPTAILFVRQSDLNDDDTLKTGAPIEPLILRARAGECIQVRLRNALPAQQYAFDLDGYSLLPNIIDKFNQNQIPPSSRVGLHPTLVSYDGLLSDGVNVGWNPEQTVAPGQSRSLIWYAGIAEVDSAGDVQGEPVEFGAVPLYSSDPIEHSNKGAVGALIIEPAGAKWHEYPKSRAKAIVDPTPGLDNGDEFREFVLVVHDDIALRAGGSTGPGISLYGTPLQPQAVNEDPTETGHAAYNYRTEPVWFRNGFLPQTAPEVTRQLQVADTFSNAKIGNRDPETPVFRAVRGENVRFRIVHPAGDTQQHTWGLHGHVFQETPWKQNSTVQGNNLASEWKGAEYGIGPTSGVNVLVENGAGGAFQVTGDYMYRDYVPWYLANGQWGIFRVFGLWNELIEEESAWLELAEEPAELGEAQTTATAADGLSLAEPNDLTGGAR